MKYTNLVLYTILATSVCGGSLWASSSVDLDAACAPAASTVAASAFASDTTMTLSGPAVAASPLVGVKRPRAGAGAGNAVESVSAAHKRAKAAEASAFMVGTDAEGILQRPMPQRWDAQAKVFNAEEVTAVPSALDVDFYSIATPFFARMVPFRP